MKHMKKIAGQISSESLSKFFIVFSLQMYIQLFQQYRYIKNALTDMIKTFLLKGALRCTSISSEIF